MWLMDAQIYTHMNKEAQSHVIDRGMALHKMIRLLSMSLGNNGYLTFMGNEFGHPEWIDFPREGNGWSYHWCRRQWNLTDCGYLRYSGLERFDAAMIQLANKTRFLDTSDGEYVFLKDEARKVISFDRNNLVFVFNFHHTECLVDFPVPTRLRSPSLRVILDSDEYRFGGIGSRIDHRLKMRVVDGVVKVYVPPRCCMVMGDYAENPIGIEVVVSPDLCGRTVRWVSDSEDRAFTDWNSERIKDQSIKFPNLEGVRLVIDGLRPYGVAHILDGDFKREDAFEISVSGKYLIEERGVVRRLM